MFKKIQDGHICWQDDVCSVLQPQGCTVLLVDLMEESTTIKAVSNCATLAML
jgi:hypothetical protein